MLPRILCALAVTVAAAPATAQGTEQFDLVCRGVTSGSELGSTTAERRYRIDLSARKWCERDCSKALPIIETTKERITLKHSSSVQPFGDVEEDFYIDRLTNKAYEMESSPGHGVEFTGTCEVRPFSGFPNP
jgi:hypothetical protein